MNAPDMNALGSDTGEEFAGVARGPCDPAVAASGSADVQGAVSAEERWQLIAAAAYRRFEQRGKVPGGDPTEDWLAAEKEVDKALRERWAGGRDSVESAKRAFLKTLSAVLTECQVQLEELGVKVTAANAALRRKYELQLAIATAKYEVARGKFVEILEHTDEAWGHLKEGADKAAHEMRLAIRELASLLK